jgi:hypothetical protein
MNFPKKYSIRPFKNLQRFSSFKKLKVTRQKKFTEIGFFLLSQFKPLRTMKSQKVFDGFIENG